MKALGVFWKVVHVFGLLLWHQSFWFVLNGPPYLCNLVYVIVKAADVSLVGHMSVKVVDQFVLCVQCSYSCQMCVDIIETRD